MFIGIDSDTFFLLFSSYLKRRGSAGIIIIWWKPVKINGGFLILICQHYSLIDNLHVMLGNSKGHCPAH